jgi:Na+-driven multidrug efflux pump
MLNYVVGLPMAYFLAFKCNLALAGLWIGVYGAQTFVFIYFVLVLKYTDWTA